MARVPTSVAQLESALARNAELTAQVNALTARIGKAEAWFRAQAKPAAAPLVQGILLAPPAAPCDRCPNSAGVYYWGASVNGVSTYSGQCFRCKGTGVRQARKS